MIFLYTKGKKGTIPQDLKDLLYYLEHSDWKNAVNDSLKEIQTMVDDVKQDQEVGIFFTHALERWYEDLMKCDVWEEAKELGHELGHEEGLKAGREEGRQEGRQEGWQEGKREGRQEGKREALISSINDILSDSGTVPDSITARISNETDLNVLSQWLKLAARSESIEAFAAKM